MSTRRGPRAGQSMYRRYDTAEDKERLRTHYERPADFFYRVLGGTWHAYSGLLWREATSITEAQEEKFDFLAGLMRLRPGLRILDVGCGWGGPLVYLCARYEVSGVGLTVAPSQHEAARERIARHNVNASIHLAHWREYKPDAQFDIIYSDEVVAHFPDLDEFFAKVYGMLGVGGRMVTKELHLTRPPDAEMSRPQAFVSELFEGTGNYRTLGEELDLAYRAGFDVVGHYQLDASHYVRTIDAWLHNLRGARADLVDLVGEDDLRRFETYLHLVRRSFKMDVMTVDATVCEKRR